MKERELINLLNRAAAALECCGPSGELDQEEINYLIEDLCVEAKERLQKLERESVS